MKESGPRRRVKIDWAVSERVMGEQRMEETRIGNSIFLEEFSESFLKRSIFKKGPTAAAALFDSLTVVLFSLV